ncbi:hypothetical protein HDV01_000596 [Terramyces sp. JEL0728]|nr:hypothetical protein HDV01_000596 [Terramyces sp. JEL0728]
MAIAEQLIESKYIPDIIIRLIFRIVLFFSSQNASPAQIAQQKTEFIQNLRAQNIAVDTDEANAPYDFPTTFFQNFLGPNLKYSANYFEPDSTLEKSELLMMEIYCKNSGLKDGMDVIDIGCGWGALVFYIAKYYPNCKITALTHSASQIAFIRSKAANLSYKINVFAADISTFKSETKFDMIYAVEVLEYMKNYELLFEKLSGWLKPEGRLYTQVFCHKHTPIELVAPEQDSWMFKFFCRGGTLPSEDLFLWFQKDLVVESRYTFPGTHYSRTANSWVGNMDNNQDSILEIFNDVYKEDAYVWFKRWRFFAIMVAEIFGSNGGNDWLIVHYLFKSRIQLKNKNNL